MPINIGLKSSHFIETLDVTISTCCVLGLGLDVHHIAGDFNILDQIAGDLNIYLGRILSLAVLMNCLDLCN